MEGKKWEEEDKREYVEGNATVFLLILENLPRVCVWERDTWSNATCWLMVEFDVEEVVVFFARKKSASLSEEVFMVCVMLGPKMDTQRGVKNTMIR